VDYIRERESASRRSGYGVSWAAGGVLTAAYAAHPERFPAGQPHPPARPVEVWINPPKITGPCRHHRRSHRPRLPGLAPSP